MSDQLAPLDLKGRKIGIGFPSSDTIPVAFHNTLMQLITQSSQFVNLGVTNAISSRITMNRNTIVKNARQMNATDILWIDTDSIVPIHALIKLLMHKEDIVCATTCRRRGTNREAIATPVDISSLQPNQMLVSMKTIGFPLMLTSIKVFDKLDELGLAPNGSYFAEPPRWMTKEIGDEIEGIDAIVGEDEYWCHLVRKAGFTIWCDMELTMEIGHTGYDTFYVANPADAPVVKVDEALC